MKYRLKQLWLMCFKSFLRVGLFFYFRRTTVLRMRHFPKQGPMIILCNHQNALLDALLIATISPLYLYYLTRASVFKNKSVGSFLKSLQMIPIYRIRDGRKTLSKNEDIFNHCTQLLGNKEAIVIFPEGNHDIRRTVRPFKKGFTKLLDQTMSKYPDQEITILPIGFNYENPTAFRDQVSVYIGEEYLSSHYLVYQTNKLDVKTLLEDSQERMGNLTVNIPRKNYDRVLKKLQEFEVDFLKPYHVNECIATKFRYIPERRKPNKPFFLPLLKWALVLLLVGPYLVWKLLVRPRIKEIEFVSTFRFATGMLLVPLWLFGVSWLVGVYFGFIYAVSFFTSAIVIELAYVKS